MLCWLREHSHLCAFIRLAINSEMLFVQDEATFLYSGEVGVLIKLGFFLTREILLLVYTVVLTMSH